MSQIEKAILRTLVYSDLFDFPLKGWEVLKWLIKYPTTLIEVEKALQKMVQKGLIEEARGYFCMPGRKKIINRRIKNLVIYEQYIERAEGVTQFLRLVPWIELVGISGGLAVGNVDKTADIDIFVVTQKRRLWLSRLIILGYFELIGMRRKRGDGASQSAGLICSNTLLDNASLAQYESNLYLAHEVLQMRLIWDRAGMYQQFLEDNLWAFDWLPNWRSGELAEKTRKLKKQSSNWLLDGLENLVKTLQLRIMKQPTGEEKIGEGALYFQPLNYQNQILSRYQQRLKVMKL